jgi:hypothetical protein
MNELGSLLAFQKIQDHQNQNSVLKVIAKNTKANELGLLMDASHMDR